jgi:hypothetical protein
MSEMRAFAKCTKIEMVAGKYEYTFIVKGDMMGEIKLWIEHPDFYIAGKSYPLDLISQSNQPKPPEDE